ncbi:S49 family peptidase [Niveispirillum sp.]|uniref:S49 family peptidase n=1 Tax=Niveispirillum sp. TaxID=1917217 RepID=UPI001B4329B3|nr:S49 family peptidase [Niveispirillum sp.]MBP7339419.1 S49 family peptidase [Niveispirillum sp.]
MNRSNLYLYSLLNRPQLIHPADGAAVLAALCPGAQLEGYNGPLSGEPRRDGEYYVHAGVAVVPVLGKLVHRGGFMQALSGVCSYQGVEDQICHALRNGHRVVLDLDTPGGTADACFALGDRIRELVAGGAIIDAWVSPRALSAGYVIAAACRRIVMMTDAEVGSIGVACYHADFSRQIEGEKITVTHFWRGAHKLDGAPTMPLTEGATAEFNASMDDTYDRFVAFVAACRSLSVEEVRATEARVFRTVDAIQMRLADETLPSLKDMIMSVSENARLDPAVSGSGTQQAQQQAAALSPTIVATTLTAAGYPNLIAGMLSAGVVTQAALDARVASAGQIKDLCRQFGVPEMTSALVESGVSVETARSLANMAKVGREGAQPVDGTVLETRGPAKAPALDYAGAFASLNAPYKG